MAAYTHTDTHTQTHTHTLVGRPAQILKSQYRVPFNGTSTGTLSSENFFSRSYFSFCKETLTIKKDLTLERVPLGRDIYYSGHLLHKSAFAVCVCVYSVFTAYIY